MNVLEYSKWEHFSKIIDKAKISCKMSGFDINDHFAKVGKMVCIGSKTSRSIDDYKLSRYACFLSVQNKDSLKEEKNIWIRKYLLLIT